MEDGLELKRAPASIGAITGTATHAAVGYLLSAKITGDVPARSEMEGRAESALADGIAEADAGVSWDDVTRSQPTALKQSIRMAEAFQRHTLPIVTPVAVEEELLGRLRDEIRLSGHPDCREARTIRDLKTGQARRQNGPQYGGYAWLANASGKGPVDSVIETFVKRVRLDREQPPPVEVTVPVERAVETAKAVVREIVRAWSNYREIRTPEAFMANPMSVLCSQKYCPAWGSNFCKEHKES